MSAPSTTVWELDPHTRAKHAILGRYLRAWTPILSQAGFPEIVYIDGFAGPGRYSKGEDGSPVIALKAALDQTVPIAATVRYLFVEKDPKRAACLEEIVRGLPVPENFRTSVSAGGEAAPRSRSLPRSGASGPSSADAGSRSDPAHAALAACSRSEVRSSPHQRARSSPAAPRSGCRAAGRRVRGRARPRPRARPRARRHGRHPRGLRAPHRERRRVALGLHRGPERQLLRRGRLRAP